MRNIGDKPDLVVWRSHKEGERCSACGKETWKGDLLLIERKSGIRCLECAGLGSLEYFPAGDAALTRRATAYSSRSAVVVRFSRARKRSERQGVLVEAEALARAKRECEEDSARRESKQEQRRSREAGAEARYIDRFAARILALLPSCPRSDAVAIARHACEKYSGRVGRAAAAKKLDPEAVLLAVRAHVRHRYTRYDELLGQGYEPFEVRPLVAGEIEDVMSRWGEPDRSCGQPAREQA